MFARLQNFFERIFSVCLSFFNWRSDEASLRRPISNLQWPRKNIAEDYYPLIRCSTLAAANLQKDKTNELEDTPARKLPKCRKSVSVISTWRRRIASLDGRKRCRCKQRERERVIKRQKSNDPETAKICFFGSKIARIQHKPIPIRTLGLILISKRKTLRKIRSQLIVNC